MRTLLTATVGKPSHPSAGGDRFSASSRCRATRVRLVGVFATCCNTTSCGKACRDDAGPNRATRTVTTSLRSQAISAAKTPCPSGCRFISASLSQVATGVAQTELSARTSGPISLSLRQFQEAIARSIERPSAMLHLSEKVLFAIARGGAILYQKSPKVFSRFAFFKRSFPRDARWSPRFRVE